MKPQFVKISFGIFFLAVAIPLIAQTIKFGFEPNGQIVKFHFDSLTIYTDTTSLFAVYDQKGNMKDYDLIVKDFVRKQISEANSDTVTFFGNYIPFDNNTDKEWYVKWAILRLLKEKKLKMYDKHGQLVTIIVTKKVGKRKDNFVGRSYINKATNEELLSETLFIRLINHRF